MEISSGFDRDFNMNGCDRDGFKRGSTKRKVTFSNKRDYVPLITNIDELNDLNRQNHKDIGLKHSFLDEIVAVSQARRLNKNKERSVTNSNLWNSGLEGQKTTTQQKILNTALPCNVDPDVMIYKDGMWKTEQDEIIGSHYNYLQLQNYLTPIESAQTKAETYLWDKVVSELCVSRNLPCTDRQHWHRVFPTTSRSLI